MNIDNDQASITPVSQQYLKIDSTGSLWIPTGTTAQRPSSPSAGFFRYNSDTPGIEYWDGSTWISVPTSVIADEAYPTVDVFIDNVIESDSFNFGASPLLSGGSSPVLNTTHASLEELTTITSGWVIFIATLDVDYAGFWVLGSMASPSAVPLTRYPTMPGSTTMRTGAQIRAKYILSHFNPTTGVNYFNGNIYSDAVFVESSGGVDVANNRISISTSMTTEVVENIVRLRFIAIGGDSLPGGVSASVLYYPVNVVQTGPTTIRFDLYDRLTSTIVDITSTGTAAANGNLYIYPVGTFLIGGSTGAMNNVATYIGADGGGHGRGGGDVGVVDYTFNAGTVYPVFTTKISSYGYSYGGDVVEGFRAYAGENSLALGTEASAVNYSIAVGDRAYAYQNSAALGYQARATGGGLAFGQNSTASGYGSVAFGNFITSSSSEHKRPSGAYGNGNAYGRSFMLFAENQDGSGPISVALCATGGIGGTSSDIAIEGSATFTGQLLVVPRGVAGNVPNTVIDFNGYAVRTSDSPYYKADIVWREAAKSSTLAADYKLSVGCVASATSCVLTIYVDTPGGWTLGEASHFSAFVNMVEVVPDSILTQAHYELELDAPEGCCFATASASFAPGDWVNIYLDTGVSKIRKASASSGYPVNGFVTSSYTAGQRAIVQVTGVNTRVSGMTVGSPVYLSTTAGTGTHTIPGAGNLVQRIGTALSATKVLFQVEYAVQT